MFQNKNKWYKGFILWLPLGLVALILCGFVNLAVQQNYRMSANDPQIQVAEDIASAVSSGNATPDQIVSPNPTQDLANTLSSFLIIYTATGTPIGSSVVLDGKIPSMPAGVSDYVNLHGEDRITWQPKPGVREAVVVTKFGGATPGFALVGRSLKEIEIRESNLNKISLIALGASWILSYLLIVILLMCLKKPTETAAAASETSMESKDGEQKH